MAVEVERVPALRLDLEHVEVEPPAAPRALVVVEDLAHLVEVDAVAAVLGERSIL